MLDKRKLWDFFDSKEANERLGHFKQWGDCYPIHVVIHPTVLCNHSCDFCYHTEAIRERKSPLKSRVLDANRVVRLIEEIESLGAKNIILSGGGEPLMHPEIVMIVSKLNSIKIDSFLYTNLDLQMDVDLLDKISMLGGIGVNINISDPEQYSTTRGKNANLDRVKHNIGELVFRGSRLYGTVIVSDTQASVEKTVGFCLKVGMAGVNVSPAFNTSKTVVHALEQVKTKFANSPVRVVEPLEKVAMKAHKVFCQSHRFDVTIGSDYGIYPCCSTAYRKEFMIANLFNYNSFNEAWTSEVRKKWVDRFEPHCETCWFAPVNTRILQETE